MHQRDFFSINQDSVDFKKSVIRKRETLAVLYAKPVSLLVYHLRLHPNRFINETLKNTVLTCRSHAAIFVSESSLFQSLFQSIKGANLTAMPQPGL